MRTFLKITAWIVGILSVVGAILYYTLLDYWVVQEDDPLLAASLRPAIAAGDRLLVFRNSAPHTGNLVRCNDPDAAGRYVVGRVVGEAGEQISVGETTSINGRITSSHFGCQAVTMTHPISKEQVTLQCSVIETGATLHSVLYDNERPEATRNEKVENGKLYIVSDNRHIHLDSRDYGQVPADGCKAIFMRLTSKEGWGASETRFNVLW